LGLRNALLGDFNLLHIRRDIGALWENFLIMERYKKMNNADAKKKQYFWRSYTGAEIDYIENNPLAAFEFKYSGTTTSQGADVFAQTYDVHPRVINKDSLDVFIF
jgi:predicted AAA+ superfamily ATPase